MRAPLLAVGCAALLGACIADPTLAEDAGATADATAGGCPCDGGAPELALAPVGDPYLAATGMTLDVRDAITGGTPPYTCSIYSGPGEGTVPGAVIASDSDPCILEGTATGRGAYGFFVTVTDAAGASVEVPVAYQGLPCTEGPASITPAAWPNLTIDPSAGQSWTVTIADVDGVVIDGSCKLCLTPNATATDPLLLDTDTSFEFNTQNPVCPGEALGTFQVEVVLPPHDLLRPDLRSWVTVELDFPYSGEVEPSCGGKRWTCHLDLLQ